MKNLQLSIPEPCHQNWDNMSPTQQGRFCNACAKEVVDFSAMSDKEVLNYFLRSTTEKVCGRVYPDQLDRHITMPKESKRRKFWYWNYITMFFLFFSKSTATKAQGGMRFKVEDAPVKIDSIKPLDIKVRSQEKAKMVGTETKVRMGSVNRVSRGSGTLYIVDDKIMATASDINTDDIEDITVLQGPKATALYGEKGKNGAIVITTKKNKIIKAPGKVVDTIIYEDLQEVKVKAVFSTKRSSKGAMSFRVGAITQGYTIKTTVVDTIKSFFIKPAVRLKVYPDPAVKGGSIDLSLQFKQAGKYLVRIINAGGALVLQKKITANAKLYKEVIMADSKWSSGLYYVQVMDENGAPLVSNSFILR